MGKATDEASPASSSSRSSSQPSHLCQACLSVLARDKLELTKWYPHHSSLDSFTEASHTRCYVCSYLFSSLDVDDQENLELLARGKVPDRKAINKKVIVGSDFSDLTETHPDPVKRDAYFRDSFGQTTSWASFTMMKLIQWELWGPLDANNPRDAAYWQIQVRLNPMYEAYIPPRLKAHRSSLQELWTTVGFDLKSTAHAPLVLTQQEFREVGLVEDLPSNTDSRETWTTVEEWLRECSEQHHCLANTNKNWFPTRLVEVLSDDMFRIVRSDSSSFDRGRGYVTLSHRWGNGDFARLTTENISALEKGQPITMLRLIFREALVVAKRMNIPYIWIDSLCIIQAGDDFADWRKESTTMAEVYSNSRCNISADWGDDDHGLFFERDPPYDRPCSLQLRLKSPETGDGVLSKSRTPPDAVPAYIILPYSWTEDVMESPINRRGWVVQERQLAPRVLHFSPEQVSWECCEKVTFEKVPLNFMDSRRTRSRLVHELDPNSVQRKRMKRLQLHNPQKAVDWPRIVAHYSACGLTKQQDVLVAIAGIARRLCPVVKDLYVTGLWAKSLPTALLWKRSAPKESRPPPTEYFAPTFSWAASDGEVTLEDEKNFSESQIIASAVFIKHRNKALPRPPTKEVRASPGDEILTDDVFGPLAKPEAEVQMRGILRSCSRVPPLPDPHSPPPNTCACPSTHLGDPGIQTCGENGTVLEVHDDRAAREDDTRADSTIYYYTIIEHPIVHPITDPVSAQYAYNHATGLFLRSVDASMGRFERVGRVEYFRARGAADILLPLGNERDLPAWSYDEATGEHTFYIV